MDNYGAPAREAQISAQLSRQEKLLADLEATTEQIIQRIGPLLSPANPSVKDDRAAQKEESVSALASTLRANNGHISNLTIRLNDVLSRLEL